MTSASSGLLGRVPRYWSGCPRPETVAEGCGPVVSPLPWFPQRPAAPGDSASPGRSVCDIPWAFLTGPQLAPSQTFSFSWVLVVPQGNPGQLPKAKVEGLSCQPTGPPPTFAWVGTLGSGHALPQTQGGRWSDSILVARRWEDSGGGRGEISARKGTLLRWELCRLRLLCV